MELTLREIVLIIIKTSGDYAKGKTLIQKKAFFVSQILNKDFGFKPHYYGPFSPAVESAIGNLIGLRFIEERQCNLGLDNTGFEMKRYDYYLTEDGQIVEATIESKPEYKNIMDILVKIKDAGDPDYVTLSIAAKAFFILKKEGKPLKPENIKEIANTFDWNFQKDELPQAIAFLEKMGLVKKL